MAPPPVSGMLLGSILCFFLFRWIQLTLVYHFGSFIAEIRELTLLPNPGHFGMFLNAIVLGEQIPKHCFSYWAAWISLYYNNYLVIIPNSIHFITLAFYNFNEILQSCPDSCSHKSLRICFPNRQRPIVPTPNVLRFRSCKNRCRKSLETSHENWYGNRYETVASFWKADFWIFSGSIFGSWKYSNVEKKMCRTTLNILNIPQYNQVTEATDAIWLS